MLVNGTVMADGGDGQKNNAGGGSGGTIYIASNYLRGDGKISSLGGAGQNKDKFGSGSGGRIKIFMYNWYNASYYPLNQSEVNIQMSVEGGDLSPETKGTLWNTPCMLGYYDLFCKPCPVGFYKNEMSNTDCVPCYNKPNTTRAYYTMTGWSNPNCPYKCGDGLTGFDENPDCLNDFNLFVDNLGGMNIFIIIICATVLGIFSVIFFISMSEGSKAKEYEEEEDNHKKLKK
jgi:hypothetical protein